eukprot:TRINITY_DN10613_c0_g2_i1.p2 TRINITY_DN10613_c0_g2~~TRINITY_DN10613_c0_g2_i1.p2  ORF type:complete len:180 (+),score=29.36 TRINITY_DN10613_c0_g2_i1:313-852(+)
MYQAGVMWDYGAQDEWLITGEMACPAGNLVFDFYGQYGSEYGDNYYVKITTDGSTWTPLWNASDLPAGENHYDAPIVIDLSAYAGQNVQIAWQFVDGDGQGLWYATYIDNITFGGERISSTDLVAVSRANKTVNNIAVKNTPCLLYTSDAADDTPCVDLGGRRIIKKKKCTERRNDVIQ